MEILKYLSTIYPSILIREGNVLRARNGAKTALVRANIDEKFPMEFTIMNLSNFLKIADLFTDPEYQFNGTTDSGYMELSEGTAKLRYKFAHPELHQNIPADVDFVPTNVEWSMKVKLGKSEIHNILNVAKTMSLDLVSFTQDGIKLSNSEVKDFTNFEMGYQNKIELYGKAPDKFALNFATNNLNLFEGDYIMESFCGAQNGAKFEKDDDEVTVWLGALPSSITS